MLARRQQFAAVAVTCARVGVSRTQIRLITKYVGAEKRGEELTNPGANSHFDKVAGPRDRVAMRCESSRYVGKGSHEREREREKEMSEGK